jgi:hypothetical protein
MRLKHILLTFILLIFLTVSLKPVRVTTARNFYDTPLTETHDAAFAVEWMDALYDRIEAEAISAPAASRLYAYAGIALYEAVVPGMPENQSLSGQLTGLPDLPLPESDRVYDWLSVTAETMRTVLNGLFPNSEPETYAAFNGLRDTQVEARLEAVGEEIVDNSIEYGERLGKAILGWVAEDNYTTIRQMDAYELPTDIVGGYVLTTEGTQPAEPYWGMLRPFALDYVDECAVYPNWEYSEEDDSAFYAQAAEVYETGRNLTPEQREIAEWWVDTPGLTGTPAGHWVKIENQLVDLLDLNLLQAAEMYGMVGMVLGDSFITCWSLKYQVNLVRPETYINQFISRRWRPYIQTPPFPEYPSGHSVVSAAAADMLTYLFGTVAFTDRTHEDNQQGVRSFTSFEAAANEAAISRLYGGIHYRSAIENGMRQGRCIVEHTLDNIVMRPFSQGGA